jgi:hypothetical protein
MAAPFYGALLLVLATAAVVIGVLGPLPVGVSMDKVCANKINPCPCSDLPSTPPAPPFPLCRQDMGLLASSPPTTASASPPNQAASTSSDQANKQLLYNKRWFDDLVPPGSRPGASSSIAGDNFQQILRPPSVRLQYSVDLSSTDAQHGPPSGCTRPWCLYGCSTASSSPAADL